MMTFLKTTVTISTKSWMGDFGSRNRCVKVLILGKLIYNKNSLQFLVYNIYVRYQCIGTQGLEILRKINFHSK